MRVIAGKARHLQLKTIDGLDTRPTTDRIKETLFNILQPRLCQCRFLDCFSGSGAIGIEALSRGASEAVFLEKSPKAAACIRENLKATHLEKGALVLPVDVSAGLLRLSQAGEVFDLIFMDPPYHMELEKKVLTQLSQTELLAEDGLLVVEASLETDFSYVEELGFSIVRTKRYKTNQHLFLEKTER